MYPLPITQIPTDRRRALLAGKMLPEQTTGVAFFVDLSGFTSLMNTMTYRLGTKSGEEKLLDQINQIFTLFIAEVHNYHGCIIDFAGDGFTCWFDEEYGHSARRAANCAIAIRNAMNYLSSLGLTTYFTQGLKLKISFAFGNARRLILGNANEKIFDVIVGPAVNQMGHGETLAKPGEIVCTATTAEMIPEATFAEPADGFVQLLQLNGTIKPTPWPPEKRVNDQTDLKLEKAWLLPELANQIAEQEMLRPNFRPAIPLFLSFSGLDQLDEKNADLKLNQFVCWVQQIVKQHNGNLLQVTIGDKGSYLYCIFGAPKTRQNDQIQALETALKLLHPPQYLAEIQEIKIGLSRGKLWAGIFGSEARSTYVVMGQQVNLAAHMMVAATKNQILLTEKMHVPQNFTYTKEEIILKNNNAITAYALTDSLQTSPRPINSNIFRDQPLNLLKKRCQLITNGRFAGLACIQGNPGSGKSTLLKSLENEISAQQNVLWLQAIGIRKNAETSFAPIIHLLHSYFQQHGEWDDKQAHFESIWQKLRIRLAAVKQDHESIDSYKQIIKQMIDQRPASKAADVLAAITALIIAEAMIQPTILIIEDLDWQDRKSLRLLTMVCTKAKELPLFILITTRYSIKFLSNAIDEQTPQLQLKISKFSQDQIKRIAEEQLNSPISPKLATYLFQHSDGNPHFLQQAILWLTNIDAILFDEDSQTLTLTQTPNKNLLPENTQSTLLACLDRLPSLPKKLIQTAAILGNRFDIHILFALLSESTKMISRQTAASALAYTLNENLIEQIDETTYRFQHPLMRLTAYEMQSLQELRNLHLMAGSLLEHLNLRKNRDIGHTLFFHYYHAGRADKAIHFLTTIAKSEGLPPPQFRQDVRLPTIMDHFWKINAGKGCKIKEQCLPNCPGLHSGICEMESAHSQQKKRPEAR